MSASPRPTYAAVQMLRGIAASGVVLFHLLPFEQKYLAGAPIVPAGLVIGQAGVDVFFVISGFIVTITSGARDGGIGPAIGFLRRRLLRIYPTYWVYFALLVVVHALAPGLMNHRATAQPSLLSSFLLLPSASPPLLLVAWTLTFELYFYLIFAVLLCAVPRHRLGGVLLGWAMVIIAVRLWLAPPYSPVTDLLFNPLNLEFIAGCLIALWGPRGSKALGAALVAIGIVGGALFLRHFGMDAPFGGIWLRVAVMGGVSALVLMGAVAWEVPGITRVPRPLRRLGDASYSIYLSHLLTIGVMGLVWRYALRLMPAGAETYPLHLVALGSAFALSVGLGWVSYRLIERRLAGGWRRTVGPSRPRPLPAEPARFTASSVR
jgi:peptidoglycan/LPS O-acetylase OafA/YrhL